jgi:hypothetical protein
MKRGAKGEANRIIPAAHSLLVCSVSLPLIVSPTFSSHLNPVSPFFFLFSSTLANCAASVQLHVVQDRRLLLLL